MVLVPVVALYATFDSSVALRTDFTRNTTELTRAIDASKADSRCDVYAFGHVVYEMVTGRNVWTSTIPRARNSFFYPSVSTSFVRPCFSDT